jgi:basic membrane lipoprotein Med (substrate-binding protein (PBP1-ABC) superfamily)
MGTFGANKDYDVGTKPVAVAVGDFNNDGKTDIAVANQISNNVSVLLGNGDGTFQAAIDYATGNGPVSPGSRRF